MLAANDSAWTCRRQGSRTSRWAAGRPRGGALHPRRGLQPPAPQPNPASKPIRPPSQSGPPTQPGLPGPFSDDRPLHVSIGPEDSRAVYRMELLASGRRVPRRVVGW